jgi:hypothetical protein
MKQPGMDESLTRQNEYALYSGAKFNLNLCKED